MKKDWMQMRLVEQKVVSRRLMRFMYRKMTPGFVVNNYGLVVGLVLGA